MNERTMRMWAFWRRVWYGTGFILSWLVIFVLVYFVNFYEPANCFDQIHNGDETGVDCGGACVRICAVDVLEPELVWTKSFEVVPGQYNTVAYVENKNQVAATPELQYTFELFNEAGQVIAERSGQTVLPPNSVYPIFEGRMITQDNQPVHDTRLTLHPAEVWQPASFNRNQFRSLDIDLSGVDDRPRLNVEIENDELVSAEDVEVVATIFSDTGIPLTTSQTFIERIGARSTQDIIFTWQQPIAKVLRSCEIPTDVVLAIDLSGSMNNDGGDPPQPVTAALAAAGQFVNSLNTADQVSVVTFATNASLVSELTSNHSGVAETILSLDIDPAEEVGYTNTTEALLVAQSELNAERHNLNARRVLVLLTDGLPTTKGDEDVVTQAQDAAAVLGSEGVAVYAIGLGENVDQTFVRAIASDETNAYFAPTGDDLASIYTEITSSICESGPTKIDIIPKVKTNFTPLR